MNNQNKSLSLMLKTLADENRLKILRLLNQQEVTVNELACACQLSDPTISHHLSRLRAAGLVNLRVDGNQHFYHINLDGLVLFKQLCSQVEVIPPEAEREPSDNAWITKLGWNAQDQQVLIDYTHNGRLVKLPNKLKKTNVILRWVATLFLAGQNYTEAEVNAILKSVYQWDYVSLRRDLVGMGYLEREPGGARYWLA